MMKTLSVRDTDDAVSSLTALQDVLASELAELEARIQTLENAQRADDRDANDPKQLSEHKCTRIVLLSGLSSIEEVMGWVRLVAEKDPDGNDLDCVESLPELSAVHANRVKLLPS